MAQEETFGKIGNKVRRYHGVNEGLTATILDNKINADNCIEIKKSDNDIQLWCVTYLELVEPTKKSGTPHIEWKFPTTDPAGIDYWLIASELTRENPIALITVDVHKRKKLTKVEIAKLIKKSPEKYKENPPTFGIVLIPTHYVMVEDCIIDKAKALGMAIPARTGDKDLNLMKSKNHFADIIKWVRTVRNAAWHPGDENYISTDVTVRMLKL